MFNFYFRAIVEDSIFFKSLCRDKVTQTVATVDVSYHAVIDVADYLVKRMEPIPVARVNQCVLRQSPSNQVKKEQGRERSKSIKIKLTKATTKFFQRRSILKTDAEGDIIANEYTKEPEDDLSLDQKGIMIASLCLSARFDMVDLGKRVTFRLFNNKIIISR